MIQGVRAEFAREAVAAEETVTGAAAGVADAKTKVEAQDKPSIEELQTKLADAKKALESAENAAKKENINISFRPDNSGNWHNYFAIEGGEVVSRHDKISIDENGVTDTRGLLSLGNAQHGFEICQDTLAETVKILNQNVETAKARVADLEKKIAEQSKEVETAEGQGLFWSIVLFPVNVVKGLFNFVYDLIAGCFSYGSSTEEVEGAEGEGQEVDAAEEVDGDNNEADAANDA